jgi:hypothetical protein
MNNNTNNNTRPHLYRNEQLLIHPNLMDLPEVRPVSIATRYAPIVDLYDNAPMPVINSPIARNNFALINHLVEYEDDDENSSSEDSVDAQRPMYTIPAVQSPVIQTSLNQIFGIGRNNAITHGIGNSIYNGSNNLIIGGMNCDIENCTAVTLINCVNKVIRDRQNVLIIHNHEIPEGLPSDIITEIVSCIPRLEFFFNNAINEENMIVPHQPLLPALTPSPASEIPLIVAEDNDPLACQICYEYRINTFIKTCQHVVICSSCIEQTTKCPICHNHIPGWEYIRLGI